MDSFNSFYDQMINKIKSKIVFFKNCSHATINTLTFSIGIQARDNFEKYLGFSIFHTTPINANFQFIIDNMKVKLASWKTKFPNQAGRTALARAFLNNIPNHVMQYITLPLKVTNYIDKIQRNFKWGTSDIKKIHMIS